MSKKAEAASSSKKAGPSLRAEKAHAFWSLSRTYNIFLTKMLPPPEPYYIHSLSELLLTKTSQNASVIFPQRAKCQVSSSLPGFDPTQSFNLWIEADVQK